MTMVAAKSIITPPAAGAVVEPSNPATRIVKDVASVVDAQVAAPATPGYEWPAASPLVSPDRAG